MSHLHFRFTQLPWPLQSFVQRVELQTSPVKPGLQMHLGMPATFLHTPCLLQLSLHVAVGGGRPGRRSEKDGIEQREPRSEK